MSRAEYMRNYRASKRGETATVTTHEPDFQHPADPVPALTKRIAELEAEVKHLKAELAKRGGATPEQKARITADLDRMIGSFNSRPFTPVPRQRDKGK